mgnify:CR=1 FL=1
MNDYVAVFHVDGSSGGCFRGVGSGRGEQASAVAIATGAVYDFLPGISDTSFDPAAGALMVRFDRAAATVADIMRCLEDHGLRISSVSQTRAETGVHMAAS